MKKYLLGSILLIASILAQAVVIEGEVTPGTYKPISVDINGNSSSPPNRVSTLNSTAVPLGANGVFTGAAEDVSPYAEVRISVFSDQASATDGLNIQQSKDGINWDVSDSYSVPASSGKTFGIGASEQFFRIVYTNGATPQGVLRIAVVYHGVATKPSSIRPQDGRTNDNDFEEIMAYAAIFNGTSWDRSRGTHGATFVQGSVAASVPSIDNPQIVGGVVRSALTGDTTLANGDAAPLSITTDGSQVTLPYATSVQAWSYTPPVGGITNSTTPVVIWGGSGALNWTFITACQLSSSALGAATEFVITNGGGQTLWRIFIPATGFISGLAVTFPTPLKTSTNNQTLSVATLTATITGAVYINCQGYNALP